MASVLLGKRLRRHIQAKVWPVLEKEGFVEFAPLRAYRVGDHTIEVVEFVPFKDEWREPRWLGGDVYANGATFALHVGAYYRDVDRLPWSEPRQGRPKCHECHRAARLAHETADSVADGRTFYPGPNGERLEETVDEALRVLESRGFEYLSHYADADGWIAAHEKGEASPPGVQEEVGLSAEEAAEMLRLCREGRAARTGALDPLHKRLHLADDHLTDPRPCAEVLAGLLVGRGRIEDAMRCLDESKQEMLRKMAA